ncbi:hypothetical protein Hanom_Chr16g01488651 [Helianthus anomalus]
MICCCVIFLSRNKRERHSTEINRREKKLNRSTASLTIRRAPKRGRPQLIEGGGDVCRHGG